MADLTFTLEVKMKPEAVEGFCAGLTAMLYDTKRRPGCLAVRVVRDPAEPTTLLFVERWESREAYDNYIAWRAERGEMDSFGAMLAGEPVMRWWPELVAEG